MPRTARSSTPFGAGGGSTVSVALEGVRRRIREKLTIPSFPPRLRSPNSGRWRKKSDLQVVSSDKATVTLTTGSHIQPHRFPFRTPAIVIASAMSRIMAPGLRVRLTACAITTVAFGYPLIYPGVNRIGPSSPGDADMRRRLIWGLDPGSAPLNPLPPRRPRRARLEARRPPLEPPKSRESRGLQEGRIGIGLPSPLCKLNKISFQFRRNGYNGPRSPPFAHGREGYVCAWRSHRIVHPGA